MLSNIEQQILLWIQSYPGISRKELEDKKLDADIIIRIREIVNTLVRKKHIVDRDDELVATDILEIA